MRGEVVMMLLLNPRNSPFVAGNFENGYDESLTTIKGRFWYVGLKKRFQFFLVKLPNKEAASFKSRLPLCPALQRVLEAMRLLIAFERSLVQHKR